MRGCANGWWRRVVLLGGLSVALTGANGALVAEEMQYPLSVAAVGEDSLVVADRMLPGLWKLGGGKAEILFQGQKTFRTPLNAVRAVAVAADGTVHAADSATRDVFKIVDGQPVPLTQGKIGIPVRRRCGETLGRGGLWGAAARADRRRWHDRAGRQGAGIRVSPRRRRG
jgi:hypothetical protein